MRTKILCFLLALGILMSVCACASETDTERESGAVSDGSKMEETTADSRLDGLADDLDFGGATVTILNHARANWTADEISVAKSNQEIVNDAIYNRRILVEDRLHIKLENVQITGAVPDDVVEEIRRVVTIGDDKYDVSASACFLTMKASLDGLYHNVRNFSDIDLAKPYWSQGFNETAEYKGTQYAFTGVALLSMYRFAFVTMFNKNLFDAYNQPYPYDTVKNGEWTMDKQAELIPIFYKDLNGNQKNDREDQHGFINSDQIGADPYWSACEIDIVRKDADGVYQIVLDIAKVADVADKMLRLYYGSDGSLAYGRDSSDGEQELIRKDFAAGRAAMATMRMMEVEQGDIRNMTDRYGILPIPKFTAEQDSYRSLLHDMFTTFAIPKTLKENREHLVGCTLEALASESYRSVTPAYYETAVKYKYMSDPESWEMLDYIYNNIYMDPGYLYATVLDNLHSGLRDIAQSGENTVASYYKKKLGKCRKLLANDIVAKLDALKEKE